MNAAELQKRTTGYYQRMADAGNARLKRPVQSNRASSIGRCARQIYYARKEPGMGIGWYTPEVCMRMEDGNEHEKIIVRQLMTDGVDIINQQRAVDDHPELKKRNITGHYEFQIRENEKLFPVEIKSMTTRSETGINGPEDLEEIWYYRPYLDQVQIYLFGTESDSMIFYIKNKDTSRPTMFDVPRDEPRIKGLLEKADLINDAVASGTPPPRQKWCEECTGCSFMAHCLPDIMAEGESFVVEEMPGDIIELIEKKGELATAYKEYEKCNKLLKEYWKTKLTATEELKTLLMGGYTIELKRQYRKGHTVKPFDFIAAKIKEKS